MIVVGLAAQRDPDQVGEEAVQLDRAVERAGQAAAAEDARLHAEVAAVFLGHHVARELADAEEAVDAAVDPAGLVDAVVVLGVGVVVAGLVLDQRQLVGHVAVDLVGAHEDEHRRRGRAGGSPPAG